MQIKREDAEHCSFEEFGKYDRKTANYWLKQFRMGMSNDPGTIKELDVKAEFNWRGYLGNLPDSLKQLIFEKPIVNFNVEVFAPRDRRRRDINLESSDPSLASRPQH